MSIFKHHKTSADRSATDRSRHKEKIRRAIREGVHHIVSDESIIGQNGKKKIKIPVRGIKEYRFVYGDNENNEKVGSAHDKTVKRGQKIGPPKKQSPGSGEPGDQIGEELYEVEITLEELSRYLFDDLNLPDLEKKKLLNIISNKFKRKGYRDDGIQPRLAKKRTLIRKIKRKKISDRIRQSEKMPLEEDEGFPFHRSDLQYKHIKRQKVKSSNAVIFFMMDTSGSMNQNKKFLARSFFFLLYHFIRNKYENTEIVFISHTSEAKEVNEDDFFKRASSGGTIMSSALDKCIEICNQRYHQDHWNVYVFHCSDGDNWPTDNEKSLKLSIKISEISQMYAYVQTSQEGSIDYWTNGGIMSEYSKISHKNFRTAFLGNKEDIWQEFRRILGGTGGLED